MFDISLAIAITKLKEIISLIALKPARDRLVLFAQ